MNEVIFTSFVNWRKDLYQDLAPVLTACREYYLKHEVKSNKCFLLIHGFTGYPGEMILAAKLIYSLGYDVYVPRLKGHGTNKEDFSISKKEEWLDLIRHAISDLKNNYAEVNLLGHSMGCCLASIVSNNNTDINSIIYVAPALTITYLGENEFNKYSLIKEKIIYQEEATVSAIHPDIEYDENDFAILTREYENYFFPKQYMNLYLLGIEARNCLKVDMHDTLVINSLDDIEISVPSTSYFDTHHKGKHLIANIKNASHTVLYDANINAQQQALKEIEKYLKNKSI